MLTPHDALQLIHEEAAVSNGMLSPLGVPVILEEEHPKAFMVCWSNKTDLGDIRITVHTKELLKQVELFKPPEFLEYIRASLLEEGIHAVQLLDGKTLYESGNFAEEELLCDTPLNAAELYDAMYSNIFKELQTTTLGESTITAGTALYYAAPEPPEPSELVDTGQNVYVGVELVRMFMQTRAGQTISEAAKGPYWDPLGYFPDADKSRMELCRLVGAAAIELPKQLPLLNRTLSRLEPKFAQLAQPCRPIGNSLGPAIH